MPNHTKVPLVLVVDDELVIRNLIAEVLRDAGCTVVTAADGEAAMQILQHLRPDVIILDLMLPYLDGAGVLQALERAGLGAIPVIVCSATPGMQQQVQSAAICGYLAKPFDIAKLERLVERSVA